MYVLILLYVLCWMPLRLFQLLHEFDLLANCTEWQFYTFIYGYIVCHWLAMANCFVNPIVYSFMSKSFQVCVLVGWFVESGWG